MKRQIDRHLTGVVLGVFLLASSSAMAAGVSVANASREQLEDAKGPYLAGVEAMEAGRFGDALDEFRRSYDIVASPNSRLMLGRALVRLGKLVEAYREFEGTIVQANELAASQHKYRRTAISAQRELDDLRSELAFIRVVSGNRVRIGGKPVPVENWGKPQPVIAGHLEVEITGSDGRQLIKQFQLEPGLTKEIDAELPLSTRDSGLKTSSTRSSDDTQEEEEYEEEEEEEEAEPAAPVLPVPSNAIPRKTVGYVAGGVGVVGVATFIGLTIAAESVYGNLKQNCVGRSCPVAAIDNAKSKSTMLGVGYAGLVVGLAGLGAGAYLILTDNSPSKPSTALSIGPGSLQLTRSF